MYRATHTENLASDTHIDLCFATDAESAIGYLRGDSHAFNGEVSGFLHTAVVTDWTKIASWDEAVSAWADAGMSTDDDTPACWYADRAERRAALAEAGFEGMIYEDCGPCNRYEHETIRVWGSSCWEIVSCNQCVYVGEP